MRQLRQNIELMFHFKVEHFLLQQSKTSNWLSSSRPQLATPKIEIREGLPAYGVNARIGIT